MAIFWNFFLKTLAFIISITLIIVLASVIFSLTNNKKNKDFRFISGHEGSNNTIAIVKLNGLIIEKNRDIYEISNPLIISPSEVKKYLDSLKDFSPKILIFSINSPGGTVSASNNLYDIIKNFKKNHKIEIFFHTTELLVSGGYWASLSGDKIYANYGSIVGSIGVKGPDWFFYDQPKSISTGIFGKSVETENAIKVYSKTAGQSKDILNPFRKPTNQELSHLQKMVNEIYDDFVRIVSKERSIESNTIIKEIGALIYTTKNAKKLNLIDGETTLDDLITTIIKEKKFKDYNIIEIHDQNRSLLIEFLTSRFDKLDINLSDSCLKLRSSISTILNYQSVGC